MFDHDIDFQYQRSRDEARPCRQEELSKRKRRRIQREEECRCKRREEEGGSSGSEDLLLSSSSSSSTSSSPSPPPSPPMSSKAEGAPNSSSSTMTKVGNPPIREMKMSTSKDTVRSMTNGDDSSDSSSCNSNSLMNSKKERTTITMNATGRNDGTDNQTQRPLLLSLVWGDDDDNTSSDDAMKRLAKRRAVARKKEMRFNNAVDIGVSTLSSSSSSSSLSPDAARSHNGNANQRPNTKSLGEVGKIHPSLLRDNVASALLTVKKSNRSIKCDDGTKKTSILDCSDKKVKCGSDTKLHTLTSLKYPTASNAMIDPPSNLLKAVKSNDLMTDSKISMPLLTSTSPTTSAEPIVGTEVRANPNINWSTHAGCLLLRTVGDYSPRDKVAGFDLDNTIVNWRCAGWPSRIEHYELWNREVIVKCRLLHDSGYRLVIFTNQGGIRTALFGKRAGTFRSLIDWIAFVIDRPLFAVASTKTDSGHHKGSPSMWKIFEEKCNWGKQVNPNTSFFVGDADGTGDATADAGRQQHQQTGTDKLFAQNVGDMRDTTMKYSTPGQYFGTSNVERRRLSSLLVLGSPPVIPQEAIQSRAALLGGYTSGPICLILVGVQGSGKSTFSYNLVECNTRWRHFSQDTIKNGAPGSRKAVEKAVREALQLQYCVVVDRMHLDEDQRRHFVLLGKQCQVPVHCLVLSATREEVTERVRTRVNHPGKVEGETGAQIAGSSLSKLKLPIYNEGFALISYSYQMNGRIWNAYQNVDNTDGVMPLDRTIELHEKLQLPMITLGTMNIKKQDSISIVTKAIQLGVSSVDTAPTYSNEAEVGSALEHSEHVKITIKVPKRAISPEQARKEVMQSLSLLQRSRVDIILLHWPCDIIEAGTLATVWKELETMKNEGLCLAIGVCNFTIMALMSLLPHCTIKPALNQVERHPLLPQYDLLEYCDSQGIILQSHTALGNGSELLLANKTVVRVAQESQMSPAQGKA